ncbi:MAG: hypothetical protein AAF802_26725 [Planctomycetota bacterium]
MAWIACLDCFALPLLGFWALMSIKLAIGDDLRRAERRFLFALVIISLVTLKTVIRSDEAWLVHTGTLGLMIVGVFTLPDRETAIQSANVIG